MGWHSFVYKLKMVDKFTTETVTAKTIEKGTCQYCGIKYNA